MGILGIAIIFIMFFYVSRPMLKAVKNDFDNEIIDLAKKTTKSIGTLDQRTKSLDQKMQNQWEVLDKKIDSVYAASISYTDLRVKPLEQRVTSVEEKQKSQDKALVELKKDLEQTQRVLHAHGRKTNDLVELIFKAAYGAKWNSEGKKVFDQYVVCGNQELWDKVLAKLTPEQISQVKKVADLEKKVVCLEKAYCSTKKRR
jgi:uncharacterized coiled-coil protein SlyX